ncbi:MAG: hypothetical protein KUG78_08285 [Kangiellaceae bacterium]|nr:hypothetical protein [Kangiellaceae bacterium]
MIEVNSKLKRALRFNALFSSICALALLMAADWWTAQFGLPASMYVIAGGVGLLLFAANLIWVSSSERQKKVKILGIIASDWGYVIGAVAALLLAASFMTAIAMAFLGFTALVVTIAAEWQRRAAFSTAEN